MKLEALQDTYKKLSSKEERKRSVLVFQGTGACFWYHYPFLRKFTLEELNDFAAIYGVSGGGMCVWLYGVRNLCNFETRSKEFGAIAKRTLANRPFIRRLKYALENKFIYETQGLVDQVKNYVPDEVMQLPFSQFSLKNFNSVIHELKKNKFEIVNHISHPNLPVSLVTIAGVYPRTIRGRNIFKGLEFPDLSVSDADFAPPELKKQFREFLNTSYPDKTIYHLNLFKNEIRKNHVFIKTSRGRFPIVGQLLDLLLPALGISSKRYQRAFLGER